MKTIAPSEDKVSNFVFPSQKKTTTEKTDAWIRQSIDAIVAKSAYGHSERKERIEKLFDLYYGVVRDDDYQHVYEPYGKGRENWPWKIKHYPIVTNKVDRLLSTYSQRIKPYQVICINDDVNTLKLNALSTSIDQSLEQQFIMSLQEAGVPTGMEGAVEQPQPPAFIAKNFEANYKDKRAISGQQGLDCIWQNAKVADKWLDGFKFWLITGEVFSFRGIFGDDVDYQICHPMYIDFDKDPNVKFIEDGSYVSYTKVCPISSVADRYHKEFDNPSAVIKKLEESTFESFGSAFGNNSAYFTLDGSGYSGIAYGETTVEKYCTVVHVQWKSFKKIGFLTFLDPDVGISQTYVDDKYVLNKEQGDISIEWEWITEWWEGTRINRDMYVECRPVPVQFGEFGDITKGNKCSYNGAIYNSMLGHRTSFVEKGYQYNLDYNEMMMKFKEMLHKSKGAIAMIDINMIPKEWGKDIDKFMMYGDLMGVLFVDYSKDSLKLSATHQNVLNLINQSVQYYTSALEFIKTEWDRVSGVNPQMESSINQSAQVGTTNQAILQSILSVENYFTEYAQFEERDINYLLNLSKIAWINNKKAVYLDSDLKQQILDIDGMTHAESEYAVYAVNSLQYNEKLRIIKEQIHAFIQNGTPGSTIIDMIESENIATIKMKVKEAEKINQQIGQQAETLQQEHEKAFVSGQVHAKVLMYLEGRLD